MILESVINSPVYSRYKERVVDIILGNSCYVYGEFIQDIKLVLDNGEVVRFGIVK